MIGDRSRVKRAGTKCNDGAFVLPL